MTVNVAAGPLMSGVAAAGVGDQATKKFTLTIQP